MRCSATVNHYFIAVFAKFGPICKHNNAHHFLVQPKDYDESSKLDSLLNEAIDAMVTIHRHKQADKQPTSADIKVPNQLSDTDTNRSAQAVPGAVDTGRALVDDGGPPEENVAASPPKDKRVLDRPATPPVFDFMPLQDKVDRPSTPPIFASDPSQDKDDEVSSMGALRGLFYKSFLNL